ncbi:hypothetical protein [Longimicrobium sp.]|uniref:hypothetical protein n=1 Tax=Longimicrobium sp. TaxID=2029185 RepID=UPI002E319FC8|nr:hypothetical protein [Longimicrobium sp.]HEX6036808.1 hypothetical protein [Longimicrobium sp.]
MKRSTFVLVPLVAVLAAGCAASNGSGSGPEPDAPVAIEVRNASEIPLRVQLCTENTCLGQRMLEGRENTVYRFSPRGSSRATVTAWTAPITRQTRTPRSISGVLPQRVRPSNRLVDRQRVDFEPGDHREVVFSTF